MSFDELKRAVWQANLDLVKAGLVVLTWGNASGIDREAGVIAIKPSGVPYDTMQPDDMVLLSLENGKKIDADSLNPSSDAPTHVLLYQTFPEIGGVVHTHSTHATSWAQSRREIPCYGTTHADCFYGPVPLTRELTPEEIKGEYELNTGRVIVERFESQGLEILHSPAALVPCHGPFTWGKDAHYAVENAIVLEEVAKMAMRTEKMSPNIQPIPQVLLDKHFLRKHGAGAYYGQKKK
jgi:L-ribulose-5-phosphate 4-epimerase